MTGASYFLHFDYVCLSEIFPYLQKESFFDKGWEFYLSVGLTIFEMEVDVCLLH